MSAVLHFFGDVNNYFHGLADIIPIHGERLGAGDDFLQKEDIAQLLFKDCGKSGVAGSDDGEDVEHTLVVAVHQKAALGGDVFLSGNLQINISRPDGPF